MPKQNKNIDTDQWLKCELYGRFIACGIAFAILAVATAVQYKKDHEKNVQHAIEQVKTAKNIATDSIRQHVR